jgi:hypothetical protein
MRVPRLEEREVVRPTGDENAEKTATPQTRGVAVGIVRT